MKFFEEIAMAAKLVMFTEQGERREFEIRGGKATVGRNKECHIQIGLGVVSRRHCQLVLKGDKLAVKDLGSSNGTYVNNGRVQEAEMDAGDTLTIGPVIFTVVVDGKPEEIKPIRTVLGTRKKKPSKPSKPAKKAEDSGSVDLEDSAQIDLVDQEDPEGSSIVALEELSKKKARQ
jgi:pSer/pThr/pTyr-binding forkhead associated (FHA) protein